MRSGEEARPHAVRWSHVAEVYARTTAPLCAGTFEQLLAAVGLPSLAGNRHPRLLDVGTGTGTLAALAAERGADVTAVDPDEDMLAIAAHIAPSTHLCRAGVPDLPFEDATFDAVAANFVVNHVHDPRAAVLELARVAAPGARLAATIWPSDQTVQSQLWTEVIEASGAVSPSWARLPQDLDFPRTSDGLADLLIGAGLTDVEARPVTWVHSAEPDSLWEAAAAGVGGIGATVTTQSAEVRDRMRAEYDRLVVRLVDNGRLVLPATAVLAAGTTPAG
ncbi:MAG: class I SAM-dependent methyltransferase [Nocardioidaceae bacterium]